MLIPFSVFAGLCSFIFCLFLVPLAKIVAKRFNILDVPDGKIKKQTTAIPYLGGLAIYLGWLIPALIFFPMAESVKGASFFLLGCTLLIIVGLIDDTLVMSPGQKFLGQSIATLFFLYGGFYLHFFMGSYIGFILSGLWILTIINAFNLIDVMDGLATLVAICSTSGFMAIAFYVQEWWILSICACFIGALLGFLIYNWPSATIYLGDTGSLFIGGFLGALALKLNFGIISRQGYVSPMIILAIPLIEITTLIIVRTYKKIPFYKASPDHFSILLQKQGWSKKKILGYVFILMVVANVTAISLVVGCLNTLQVVLLAIIFLFVWFRYLMYGSFWYSKKPS